jgi:PII-like signaling protein
LNVYLEQLTIYVGESDTWHGESLYLALVIEARKRGIAGATVTRGVAGYGSRKQHQIATARMFELSSDLPMLVTIIDTAESIAAFLPTIEAMVTGGIVIQETVAVVHHAQAGERKQ